MSVLQKIFDKSADVADKLEMWTFQDTDFKHANLQSTPKWLLELPFLGVCKATELTGKAIRRPLDTSKFY